MLTLTENASQVVKSITDQSTSDVSAGLRISHEGLDTRSLQVAPVENPQPSDQVIENEGARVFLAEDIAGDLDDKVLDAVIDREGGVQFSLDIQPSEG